MKLFFKVFDWIINFSFLICGLSFLYCLSMVLLLNVVGNFFTYNELFTRDFSVEQKSKDTSLVEYSYEVNGVEYKKQLKISSELIENNAIEDVLVIRYNSVIPWVSYVKGIKIVWEYYFGMVFSLFLLLVARIGKIISSRKFLKKNI